MADLNRTDIIDQMVARVDGINHRIAKACLEAFVDTVQEALLQHRSVCLREFGTFGVRLRLPRKGIHPRTHQPLTIGAQVVPYFLASPRFKKHLNPPSL